MTDDGHQVMAKALVSDWLISKKSSPLLKER
jgi:hypothetical protein